MMTAAKKTAEVEKEIKKLHSYDLPAIIKINAKSNNEFKDWIKRQT